MHFKNMMDNNSMKWQQLRNTVSGKLILMDIDGWYERLKFSAYTVCTKVSNSKIPWSDILSNVHTHNHMILQSCDHSDTASTDSTQLYRPISDPSFSQHLMICWNTTSNVNLISLWTRLEAALIFSWQITKHNMLNTHKLFSKTNASIELSTEMLLRGKLKLIKCRESLHIYNHYVLQSHLDSCGLEKYGAENACLIPHICYPGLIKIKVLWIRYSLRIQPQSQ